MAISTNPVVPWHNYGMCEFLALRQNWGPRNFNYLTGNNARVAFFLAVGWNVSVKLFSALMTQIFRICRDQLRILTYLCASVVQPLNEFSLHQRVGSQVFDLVHVKIRK